MIKNIKWLLIASLSIVACSKDDETVAEAPLTAGSANFSKYVSLGNSITAGFSDNALFIAGQEHSYANLLAQQFKLVGGGEFKTPLMNDNVGGFTNPMLGQFPRLIFNGAGPVSVGQSPYNQSSSTVLMPNPIGGFNNFGVPGAKTAHLIAPGYGNPAGIGTTANPYFVRFATSYTTSVLQDAMAQSPTFFSLWIGNNDVLGYALSGGNMSTSPITPSAGAIGVGFDATYDFLVTTLTSGGAKGVVANIPYVFNLPFFTTVGYNPIPTLSAAQASALNSAYAPYNGGLQVALNASYITAAEATQRTIVFTAGDKKPVVIVDEYLTNLSGLGLPSYRLSTKEDYLLLSADGVSAQANLGAGGGTSVPLADKWVLSKNEIEEITTATNAFNAKIMSSADAKGLAYVDANSLMSQVFNGGYRFGNYSITASYVTGGGFSMDGIHPSSRGQALIATKFLEAINVKYGSNFKGLDLASFPIQYPATIN